MKVEPTTKQLIAMLYDRFPEMFAKREWVGLDAADWNDFNVVKWDDPHYAARWAEAKLKEKNT